MEGKGFISYIVYVRDLYTRMILQRNWLDYLGSRNLILNPTIRPFQRSQNDDQEENPLVQGKKTFLCVRFICRVENIFVDFKSKMVGKRSCVFKLQENKKQNAKAFG